MRNEEWAEEWNELAEEVSEELWSERSKMSETQCRRMIDSLKRKYRKNKIKVDIHGSCSSKWLFFNKMDMLFTLRLSWNWGWVVVLIQEGL